MPGVSGSEEINCLSRGRSFCKITVVSGATALLQLNVIRVFSWFSDASESSGQSSARPVVGIVEMRLQSLAFPEIVNKAANKSEREHYVLSYIYTHPFYGPLDFVQDYPGEPVPKPIWILLKQETVSGSGIGWAICKSAPRSRPITMPAPHHSVCYRPDALPATQPTVSKH